MLLALLACTPDDGDVKTDPEPTPPLEIANWNADVAIAPESGDSQGEPSAYALADGTLIASWMQMSGQTLYIRYSRSTDGGVTWTEPDFIDKDQYGYQNDPVFLQSGDYLYFTWLAVEGSNYDKSSIYCVDSTDGGQTWSEKVRLTEKNAFNDRQWMAGDGNGRIVATWDVFPDSYSMEQVYAESAGGCAGFSSGETVFDGYFLNGVPAIDANGDVWISRDQFTGHGVDIVIQKKEGDGWGDEIALVTTDFPGYFTEPDADEEGDTEAAAEEEEEEERDLDAIPEEARREILEELHEQRTPPWKRTGPATPLKATLDGMYSGTYSPVLGALPDGNLVMVGLGLQEGSDSDADVWFATYEPVSGAVDARQLVNEWAGGAPQQEPWMTIDPFGGIHVAYFDGRDGAWRMRSASSADGGATFTERDIGDDTFKNGFGEDTYEDYYAWVGHFQAISSWSGGVLMVWGDSRDKTSRIFSDVATLAE